MHFSLDALFIEKNILFEIFQKDLRIERIVE